MNASNKIIGVLFGILGVLCIFYPIISSLWIEIFIGAAFFVGAVFAIVRLPKYGGFWEKFFWVVLAILYGLGGIFMLMNPVQGSVALMIALGAVFFVEGILILVYWAKNRNRHPILMFINGLVTLVLGVILLANLDMALWAIGTLAGIDFLFTGIAMFAMPEDSAEVIVATIPSPIPPQK